MTEAQIQEIKDATNRVYREIPERHCGEVVEANLALSELQKRCDHRFPDGSSAWDDGFMMEFCNICSADNG